ncbi:hypothetical protein [Mycolicibacterium mageritense]|uniref:hypothetical protein n=1 Tax=Mycolicibacterium mageritense TaxID=53462 RepID=UPI001E597F34|nr:hypothetical protein [Mycolicibacterium mageritense]MCC9181150.1 hypothetical protein [Mycolicibacterium mageritense]
MSDLTPDVRRAEQLMQSVIQTVMNHRTRFFSEPAAEGFRVYLSVSDARLLDEQARRRGDFFPRSSIRDGDTGTVMGLPFTADASVRVGRVFIGYRVDTLEVMP